MIEVIAFRDAWEAFPRSDAPIGNAILGWLAAHPAPLGCFRGLRASHRRQARLWTAVARAAMAYERWDDAVSFLVVAIDYRTQTRDAKEESV